MSKPAYRPGCYAWRRSRGLLTWKDVSLRWRMARYAPAGCRSPIPGVDCRLPRWRASA